MLKLTEHQIISKHDPSVRGRAWIELQIVNKLIETATNAGYTIRVFMDPDDEYDELNYDVRSAIFDLDECYLVFYVGDKIAFPGGWLRLVLGNDGYDIVSDYSTNLETFLKPVNELADWWGG